MRFRSLIAIVFTLLAVFPPSWTGAARADELAVADDAHPEGGHPAKGGEKHGEEGHKTEGTNPFAGSLDLTIWSVVVFVLLVGILYTFAWKSIREGLDKREQDIARDKEEAKAARDEAAQLREQLQRDMAKAQAEVQQILAKARQDADTLAAERDARSKAELQAERDRLNRDLAMARDQALQEIWAQAATLSTSISAKVLQRQFNGDDHRRLIDEALAELRTSAEEKKRDHLSAHA